MEDFKNKNIILERHTQSQIENWMYQEKVLILYGARQVGKTTLCKKILKKHNGFFLMQKFNL